MPKFVDLEEALAKARNAVAHDKNKLFDVATRLPAAVYQKVVEKALSTGRSLSAEIAEAVARGFADPGPTNAYHLSPDTGRLVRMAAAWWGCDVNAAADRLAQASAVQLLWKEMDRIRAEGKPPTGPPPEVTVLNDDPTG
jgi:hypothetical protein